MPRFLIFLFFSLMVCNIYAQQTMGLFFNDSTALNGYTLISPNSSNFDYLIDNCGNEIHSWESNYTHGESAYLLENGNLLRTARIPSSFNAGGTGGRLEIYNWEGDLIWAYNYSSDEYHHHHDVEILPNGNILLIAWEAHSVVDATEAGRRPPIGNTGVWAERIVEIEPIGSDQINVVWEWSLWDHLIQDYDSTKANYGVVADHPELINLNFEANTNGQTQGADWIHLNSIDYNAQLDQIVINSRVFNEFWVIDHSTTTAEAAGSTGGNSGKGGDILYRWGNPQAYDRGLSSDQKFFGQHDVQWIAEGYPDEGKILIYNNGAGRPEGSYSSVDIIVPPIDSEGNYQIGNGQAFGPTNLFWTYDGFPNDQFFSANISGANRLQNGNTLICVGRDGHIIEIDPDKNIVWDYINPIKSTGPAVQGTTISNNSLFRAYRYATDYPAFEGKDLTPSDPLELNPLPSDCQIFGAPVSTNSIQSLQNVSLVQNPVSDFISLDNSNGKQLDIRITDLTGRILHTEFSNDYSIKININNWLPGLYILQISDTASKQFFIQKIIKQ